MFSSHSHPGSRFFTYMITRIRIELNTESGRVVQISGARHLLPMTPAERILTYFNKVTGKKLRTTTKENMQLIEARLREGYTEADFRHVIDVKQLEWRGTEMYRHMQPPTLFIPSHFDNYLNTRLEDVRPQRQRVFGDTLTCSNCHNIVYQHDTVCRTCGKELE
jgi:uncharacterized phage protein (TIGR02220 family)